MSDTNPTQIHPTGEATGFIPAPDNKGKPITVVGTNSKRAGFNATCLQQALNARCEPVESGCSEILPPAWRKRRSPGAVGFAHEFPSLAPTVLLLDRTIFG